MKDSRTPSNMVVAGLVTFITMVAVITIAAWVNVDRRVRRPSVAPQTEPMSGFARIRKTAKHITNAHRGLDVATLCLQGTLIFGALLMLTFASKATFGGLAISETTRIQGPAAYGIAAVFVGAAVGLVLFAIYFVPGVAS